MALILTTSSESKLVWLIDIVRETLAAQEDVKSIDEYRERSRIVKKLIISLYSVQKSRLIKIKILWARDKPI